MASMMMLVSSVFPRHYSPRKQPGIFVAWPFFDHLSSSLCLAHLTFDLTQFQPAILHFHPPFPSISSSPFEFLITPFWPFLIVLSLFPLPRSAFSNASSRRLLVIMLPPSPRPMYPSPVKPAPLVLCLALLRCFQLLQSKTLHLAVCWFMPSLILLEGSAS